MLLVPTYLAPSEIHGIGVFTPEPLRPGTVIWEFTPGVDWELGPEELEAFPEPYRSRLRTYSYLDERGLYVLCGDNARYMNHADVPNCDDTGEVTVTARAIEAGEELTCDYRTFDVAAREEGVEPASGAVAPSGQGTVDDSATRPDF